MRKVLEIAFTFTVMLFIAGSLAGFLLDRPVFVSYAYSESMTPTIGKGDLFFINPLARNFDVGDIIVFHRRDGWTVHRIFAVTEEGFITKGDFNVATDQQEGKYPLVQREDIAGKVLSLFGHPLVVRGGGDFVESTKHRLGNIYAVVAILVLGAVLTFSNGTEKRKRGRRGKFLKIPVRSVYGVVSVLIVAGFLFVTVSSWGTLAFSYSSTLAGGQREGWYLPGSSFEKNLTLENNAVYPFYYFVGGMSNNTELITADRFALDGRSDGVLHLRVKVPKDTRVYREEITVHSYPAILPFALVSALYDVNPYAPLLTYSIELGLVLLAFYYLADLGRGDVLRLRIRRGSLIGKIFGDG